MDMQTAGDIGHAEHRRTIERANRVGWMHDADRPHAADPTRRLGLPPGFTTMLKAARAALSPVARANPMPRLDRTVARWLVRTCGQTRTMGERSARPSGVEKGATS